MIKRELRVGDVVQIDPAHDPRFGGCFMVVSEPKSFGAMGYCASPEESGLFYYRCSFENMEFIGHAEWMNKSDMGANNGSCKCDN
jgi:hypothetical protein